MTIDEYILAQQENLDVKTIPLEEHEYGFRTE